MVWNRMDNTCVPEEEFQVMAVQPAACNTTIAAGSLLWLPCLLLCTSLWIKASAKLLDVNANVIAQIWLEKQFHIRSDD